VDLSILELNVGSCDQIHDGSRDQDLARLSESGDPGPDVHGDSGNSLIGHFHLARVNAGANLNAEFMNMTADAHCAPNRPSRPIEGGEETIASGVDFSSPKAGELMSHRTVMQFKEITPLTVTHGRGPLGGGHDVGEENRRQHPFEIWCATVTGEELLNLIGETGLIGEGEVLTGQFDEASTLDVVGQPATVSYWDRNVIPAVQDQCRHGDGRQHGAHVDAEQCV